MPEITNKNVETCQEFTEALRAYLAGLSSDDFKYPIEIVFREFSHVFQTKEEIEDYVRTLGTLVSDFRNAA